MKTNPSQYTGTLKDSICSRCGVHLNNKTRLQQDQHLEDHKQEDIDAVKQRKLF